MEILCFAYPPSNVFRNARGFRIEWLANWNKFCSLNVDASLHLELRILDVERYKASCMGLWEASICVVLLSGNFAQMHAILGRKTSKVLNCGRCCRETIPRSQFAAAARGVVDRPVRLGRQKFGNFIKVLLRWDPPKRWPPVDYLKLSLFRVQRWTVHIIAAIGRTVVVIFNIRRVNARFVAGIGVGV